MATSSQTFWIVGVIIIFLLQLAALVTMAITANRFETKMMYKTALRKLWTDHVIWTREYVIAAKFNSATKGQVAARLLRNQDDIGEVLAIVLGDPAFGAAAAQLLKEHILIAADLVEGKGDANTLRAKWYVNGSDIGDALGAKLGDTAYWREMMKMHLDATLQEVAAIMSDNPAHIAIFDEHILPDALDMADKMAASLS